MERILEMLMVDRENQVAERQQRDAKQQQLETHFACLEAMMKNLSKHSDDGMPKGSVNKEKTPKNHTDEGKTERWRKLEISYMIGNLMLIVG